MLYLWSGVLESLRACARRGADRLSGIGVTTWSVDYGLLYADGRLIENPVYYRDHRTDGMDAAIRDHLDDRAFYRLTGMTVFRMGTLPQLRGQRRQHGDALERARSLLQMPDLLRFFLGGERSTEPTIAGSTLMTDVHRQTWRREVLDAFGLPAGILPRIGRCAETSGSLPRGELVRSQLEGLALLYRRTFEELVAATGTRPDGICLVGGECRNRLFCRLVADAVGLPVAAGPVETTAVGNIGLQMAATGALGGPADVRALAASSFPQERFDPYPDPAWEEASVRYRAIVR